MSNEQEDGGAESRGAWVMRTTVDRAGNSSGWEKCWDPDATPMGEAEAEVRYQGVLEILFGPSPDDA